MKRIHRTTVVAAIAAASLVVSTGTVFATGQTVRVNGASSVALLLDKCKTDYATATGDTASGYTAAGSGTGKNAIAQGQVDIGLSDSENTNANKPAGMLHIPFGAWPVTVMYNLNTTKSVNLSTETIAKIFAGQITMWNDPQIVADNNKTYKVPVYKVKDGKTVLDKNGAPVILRTKTIRTYFTFPNKKIIVVYRNGGSGTSNNFTTALNKLHPTIWTKPGNDAFATAFPGDITKDPIGFQGGANAAALAQIAQRTKYSITYNEFSFAKDYGLGVANVINPAGNAISPSSTEGILGAFSVAKYTADGLVTFDYTNKLASQYPFSATTYALVLPKYASATLAGSVKDWISFHSFDCPKVAVNSGFAQITKTSDLGKQILAQLAKIG
jgi:phosphate transport system substrate-binding protein